MLCRLLLTGSLCFIQIFYGQTTFKNEQDQFPRVRQARANKETYLDSLFQSKDIEYPPHKILITAYKNEQLLELWARPETTNTFTLIKQYRFTAYCGTLGPKRKQGDLQIPEGLYIITHFNPCSHFHLSMLISYPNESDRILSPYTNLGGEIRIHGSSVTIGCIPIGDNAIEELYITCVDARSHGQGKIPVYIFPNQMDNNNWNLIMREPENDTLLIAFWKNLRQGYDIFKKTAQELEYSVNDKGYYNYKNPIHENFHDHPWLLKGNKNHILNKVIQPPSGFERIHCPPGSFADWLRHLRIKSGNTKVYLYNGAEKSYQAGHYAVLDIDVGQQDLQQCADAIIRLRAEYLYANHYNDNINFHITNGDVVAFRKWINGYRPIVRNNVVFWHKHAQSDSSYKTLRMYLDFIFSYAGTYSLDQELLAVRSPDDMRIGDVFIQGGFPGHAVLVIDMSQNPLTGEKVFLLCQSYMPAQDIHILKNLNDPVISPWYALDFGDTLYIPEWTFHKNNLRRF